MALSYDYTTKRIGVPQVDAQPLTMQALINSIRTQEASERGIVDDAIADASGKNDLGGGVYTGITVALRSSWALNFTAGAYQATVSGGNLADALSRIYNTGSPQVLVQASAAATIVNSSGSTPPTSEAIAAAVLAAAQDEPIHSRVKIINDTTLAGSGASGDPMRPA